MFQQPKRKVYLVIYVLHNLALSVPKFQLYHGICALDFSKFKVNTNNQHSLLAGIFPLK